MYNYVKIKYVKIIITCKTKFVLKLICYQNMYTISV